MVAITAPTGALSPSLNLICSSTPSSNDSSTMSALSVSTSAIASPRAILSPGCLSHRRILPSSIVSESLGIVISLLMIFRTQVSGQFLRRFHDVTRARQGGVLEMLVIWHRTVERGNADDRCVERVEGGLVNLCRDFSAGPA